MKYSLDTSAVVQAWRTHYPPEVFPAVWERLDDLIDSGALRATEEVLYELERKDDEVLSWVREREELIIDIDQEIQIAVQAILEEHKRLLDTRKSRSGADPFVIALAQIHRAAVVTYERPTNSPTRPNIPDVCRALGVRCITFLELLREQGWVFRS